MVDRVLALPEGTRLYLLAPVVRGRKGEYRKELAELQKKGFQRVKVDGTFYEIADVPALDKKIKHDIDVVVDRIVVRPDIASRLADSFETALELADGLAVAELADAPKVPPHRNPLPGGEREPPPRRRLSPSPRGERGEVSESKAKAARTRARAHRLLAAIRLPGVRLHHRRDRAAAVLLQQSVRRLPEMRRARRRTAYSIRTLIVPDDSLSLAKGAIAPWARTQYLALLHADAPSPCRALRILDRTRLERAAEKGPGRDPVRLGRRGHPVHL